MMRLTPMVKNILIINIGIALLQWIFKLPLNNLGGLRVVFSDEWAPYQFLTYMWLHSTGNFMHLLGNMFGVFIFGPMLEQVWGPKRFLQFYLICGVGAGLLFGAADYFEKLPLKSDKEAYMDDPDPEKFRLFILDYRVSTRNTEVLAEFSDQYYKNSDSPAYIDQSKRFVEDIYSIYIDGFMVGASGAMFGILMAFGLLFPNTQLFLLFLPIPIKAKYLVLFYGLYELYAEFSRMPGDHVAHLAHLGGMAIAFVLLKIWQKDNGRFY